MASAALFNKFRKVCFNCFQSPMAGGNAAGYSRFKFIRLSLNRGPTSSNVSSSNEASCSGSLLERLGPGEFEKVAHDAVQPGNFFRYHFQVAAESGVGRPLFLNCRQPQLDRNQRVADFMGHAGGKFAH